MQRRHAVIVLLTVLLIAGFTIRFVPVKTGYHYWDETVYLQHAEILAGHHPNNYNEFDFRPPLFSLLLGGLFLVHHDIVAAHVFVAGLASIGILLTFLLGRSLYSTRVGLVAALVYTLSPTHITYAHDILVDTALPLLWIMVGYGTWRMLEQGRRRDAVLTGAATGMAVLMKFTSLVLLVAVPAALLYHAFRSQQRDHAAGRGVTDQASTFLGAAGAVLIPYFLWSYAVYGSPAHTLLRGMELSGAPDPFITYLIGMPQLIVAPFLVGLLLFLPRLRNPDARVVVLAMFTVALLIPLQFLIENRQMRFLLPVLPFLSVMSAAGLERVKTVSRVYPVLLLVLAVLAAGFVAGHPDMKQVSEGRLVTNYTTPAYQAALWLRSNAGENTMLYANYQWPPLAYYTGMRFHRLPVDPPFQHRIGEEMAEPGYLYLAAAATDRDPSLAFVQQDSRFVLNTTLPGRNGNDAYIFYYTGE